MSIKFRQFIGVFSIALSILTIVVLWVQPDNSSFGQYKHSYPYLQSILVYLWIIISFTNKVLMILKKYHWAIPSLSIILNMLIALVSTLFTIEVSSPKYYGLAPFLLFSCVGVWLLLDVVDIIFGKPKLC